MLCIILFPTDLLRGHAGVLRIFFEENLISKAQVPLDTPCPLRLQNPRPSIHHHHHYIMIKYAQALAQRKVDRAVCRRSAHLGD